MSKYEKGKRKHRMRRMMLRDDSDDGGALRNIS